MAMIHMSFCLLLLASGCSTTNAVEAVVDSAAEFDDDTATSLMQFRGMLGKNAAVTEGKTSLDSQFSFLQDLVKQHVEGKLEKLPAEIKGLLEDMEEYSKAVQTKMKNDHDMWSADLQAKKDYFDDCKAVHLSRKAEVEKSLANCEATQNAHCDCRGTEAELNLNHQGHQHNVECLLGLLHKAEEALEDFMNREDHCEECGAADWEGAEGADEFAKMRAWLTGRKTACAEFYAEKAAEFEALKEAHAKAKDAYEDAVAKEEAAKEEHEGKMVECDGKLDKATNTQCAYINRVNDECREYDACYARANASWTNVYDVQIVDYKDRMSAWIAAEKISCILKAFDMAAEGDAVDEAHAATCHTLACDESETECWKLNMASALDWTAADALFCGPPPEICTEGELDPACALDKNGLFTPVLKAGAYTEAESAECKATPTPMARVGQVSNKCEQCAIPGPHFLGCFKDKSDRDLEVIGKWAHGGGATLTECSAICAGYKYFGRQYKSECWCGNSYGKHGTTAHCDCSADAKNHGGWVNCMYSH